MDARRWQRTLEGLLGIPFTAGNRVERLRNGVEIFPAMLDAIQNAMATVDMTTFVYWTGEVAEMFGQAMCARVKDDVRVRLILDAFGARYIDTDLLDRMHESGVLVQQFRPPAKNGFKDLAHAGHRTHRKVLICDEEVAFTGGVGIAEEWEGDARNPDEWRDTHFRIQGPAVDGLRAAFVDDWLDTEPEHPMFDDHDRFPEQPDAGDAMVQVVRGEAEFGWSDVAMVKHALLELAEKRVRITSAYFSPDPGLTRRLAQAAQRGVDVEVLMPGEHSDKRLPQVAGETAYEDLLDAGVKIRRYEKTMLHAKVITVDGLVANVGSANLNSRSLQHDQEVDLVVLDPALVEQLDADYAEDIRHARRVDADEWQDRSVLQRVQEKVVGAVDDLV